MATIVKTTFQLKRGTAAKWVELNLTLAPGEPGFEIDTKRLKIGDGKTSWLNLPYVGESSVVNATTHSDFPATGAPGIIYKAEDEKLLYQWNSKSQSYELLGSGGEGGSSVIIDTVLSETSGNAIANSAVTKALKELEAKIPTVPGYSFGEGIIVKEVDGIQEISVDSEFIRSLIPKIDLSPYLTQEDLNGLATEQFVTQKIAEAQLAGGDVDLSSYYTKGEVDELIKDHITAADVDTKIFESVSAIEGINYGSF